MTTNIYPFLKPYFWATLVSAVISALSSNNNNSILISVISLITSVICLYELYQMRTISDHLSRAFSYQIIGTIGALASLIIGLLALLANPITNMGFMVFTLIIALIFAIIGIIGSYHFYWGLDELIEPNGYDYPVGRIKWCFYLAFIEALIVGLLSLAQVAFLAIIVSAGFSAARLYLLYTYLQAVRVREEQPLRKSEHEKSLSLTRERLFLLGVFRELCQLQAIVMIERPRYVPRAGKQQQIIPPEILHDLGIAREGQSLVIESIFIDIFNPAQMLIRQHFANNFNVVLIFQAVFEHLELELADHAHDDFLHA